MLSKYLRNLLKISNKSFSKNVYLCAHISCNQRKYVKNVVKYVAHFVQILCKYYIYWSYIVQIMHKYYANIIKTKYKCVRVQTG